MTSSRFSVGAVTALKYLLVAAFAGLLLSTALGGRVSAATMEEVSAAVTAAADLSPMTQGDNQRIRRLYGIEPDQYDGLLLYYPTSSMAVEELFLVKLRDTSQQDAVRAALEARVAAQITNFEGYGPEQVALLEKAVVAVRGNYALLIVAEDTDTVLRAFENAL